MNVGLDEVIHGTTIYARGLLRCAMKKNWGASVK